MKKGRAAGATDELCAALNKHVLPAILRERQTGQPIRIWVPGCATGEDVYVIGIALLEVLASSAIPIQIFGTDIDERAIATARAGCYTREQLASKLSPEQLQRFFIEVRDGLQVLKGLRDLCVFARHDLRIDPPFSRLDLISFHQELGQLPSALRRTLLPLLHFALAPTGMLMLAAEETLDDDGQLFTLLDARHRLYVKRPVASRPRFVPAANSDDDATEWPGREPLAVPLPELETLRDFTNQEVIQVYALARISNEELQSTIEELETAQEELRSTNEELEKTNDVLGQRNRELSRTRDELMNLLSNITIPVLMLDDELCIRQFNPVTEQVMKLRAADLGRPIHHLRLNLKSDGIEAMLQQVKQTDQGRDLEVRDNFGRWHVLRARPCLRNHGIAAGNGVLLMLVDIDQLRRSQLETEHTLNRTQAELRALTASLITAQEEERRRVSRELHDDLGQKVALIALHAARLEQSPLGQPSPELAELRRQTAQLTEDLRRIALRLHPAILDDLGLQFALKRLVEDFGRTEERQARFGCHGLPAQIPHEVAGALYRITQEALRNVAKHAGKTRVHVSLRGTSSALTLRVRDHGNGFSPSDLRNGAGMGIMSMEERAHLIGGRFKLKTSPGQGVAITVEVPSKTKGATSNKRVQKGSPE